MANWTSIITAVASFIVAISSTVAVVTTHNLTRIIHNDDQSNWVTRLVKVATTPDQCFGLKQILEMINCLRPFPNDCTYYLPNYIRYQKHYPAGKSFAIMTDWAIKYCQLLREHPEFLNQTDIRLIQDLANALLKNHREYLRHLSWFRARYIQKHFGNYMAKVTARVRQRLCSLSTSTATNS